MNQEFKKANIYKHGFQLLETKNLKKLNIFKKALSLYLKEKYSFEETEPDIILNKIHHLAKIKSDKDANELVLDIIKTFADKYDFAEIAFDCFTKEIIELLGPDLHSQRNNNIVFQYPNSNRYSELHTDSPPNSPYEVVFWIPLVNCYDTKSFFVIPKADSKNLIEDYKNNKYPDWTQFKDNALKKAVHLKVEYKQALVFWTGIMHGSLSNQTDESRWCLNVRFKNLFAPCGQHDPLTYYRIFKTSSISKLALEKF